MHAHVAELDTGRYGIDMEALAGNGTGRIPDLLCALEVELAELEVILGGLVTALPVPDGVGDQHDLTALATVAERSRCRIQHVQELSEAVLEQSLEQVHHWRVSRA